MKNNSFLTRVISAIVIIMILIVLGIAGGDLLAVVLALVSLIGISELFNALHIKDNNSEGKGKLLFITASVLAVIYYAVITYGIAFIFSTESVITTVLKNGSLYELFTGAEVIGNMISIGRIITIAVYIITSILVFMSIYVFTFPRYTIEDICYAIFGSIYVPVFISFIYMTRMLPGGVFYFWLIFGSSWACDSCAYLVGVSIGKHKLAPVLSPKKSIEGAIGGVIGAMIIAYLFEYLIEYKLCGGVNHGLTYMIVCGIGSVFSQLGDLAASAIKRNKDIKDYGTLIPGHGGIMDRFDSVIFIAPFIYFLCALL